jgi:hypothetical protein
MFVYPCIIVQFIQKISTRCNIVSKLIIPYLYEAQHNQEPKTALAASGLHMCKDLNVWLLDAEPKTASAVLGS